MIARVPLDEGSLGGKMTLETKFPKGDWRAMYFGPKNLTADHRTSGEAKSCGAGELTLPQMALRYILSFPAVSTIIVGMRKPEHVRQNIATSDSGGLDAGLLRTLKEASLGSKARALGGFSCHPERSGCFDASRNSSALKEERRVNQTKPASS